MMCGGGGCQEAGGQEDGDSGPECPLSSCVAQSLGDREAEAVSTDEYVAIEAKIKWEETNQGKHSSVCIKHLRLIY